MSNWNTGLADRVLTSSWDDVGVVTAEQSKIKVGFPCAPNCDNAPTVRNILGDVESITCIMIWNGHKKLPDTRFQQQTSTGENDILKLRSFCSVVIFSFATTGWNQLIRRVFESPSQACFGYNQAPCWDTRNLQDPVTSF